MEHRPHIVGTEIELGCRGVHQHQHIPMGDLDTLGQTCRTGRVDHIRTCVCRNRRQHRFRHRLRDQFGHIDDVDLTIDRRPQLMPGHRLVGDHHTHTRVGNDVGQPRHGITGVQRHIRRAGLQHPQNRRHQVHRPRRRHTHEVTWPHTPGNQTCGHRIRPAGQLRIRR